MQAGIIDQASLDRLLDVIGGDVEDLQELIEEFSDSAPGLVVTMRKAVESGDTDALRIAAHTLKSNARDMGAIALASLCKRLEHACRAGAVEDPAGSVEAIDSELRKARVALATLPLADE